MAKNPAASLLPVAAEFTKLVNSLGTAIIKVDQQIQLLAVLAIGYSIIDRNTTPMNQLLAKLSYGHRKDALVAFFEKHGNAAWMTAEKTIKFYDAGATFDADVKATLMQSPWAEAKRAPKVVSSYDVADEVQNLMLRLQKKQQTGTEMKNADLLRRVNLLVAEYRREQWEQNEA